MVAAAVTFPPYGIPVAAALTLPPDGTGADVPIGIPLMPPPDGTPENVLLGIRLPLYVSADAGMTWTNSGPRDYWQGVASSADGTKLAAVSSIVVDEYEAFFGDGGVYVSTNSGATWDLSSAPLNTWSCVASSADGAKLVAAATMAESGGPGLVISGDGGIYTSTDSGQSWMLTSAPRQDWSSIASSADGSKLVAVSSSSPGGIYVSANSGETWSQGNAPSNAWNSVASSADGAKLVAATGARIYISSDSGQSWVPNRAGSDWTAVCSSADGTKLLAAEADYSGDSPAIYSSADSGMTWVAIAPPPGGWSLFYGSALASSADGYRVITGSGAGLFTFPYLGPWRLANDNPNRDWTAVASSFDGTKLAAISFNEQTEDDQIYTSTNSGTSWSTAPTPKNDWGSIVSSSDGTTLVAVATNGLYVSTNSGAGWRLALAVPGGLSVTCSADGTRLAAISSAGVLYLSTNAGAQWAAQTNSALSGAAIASSADGTKLVAASEPIYSNGTIYSTGAIYLSTDSGQSWVQASAPTSVIWTSVASSADGTELLASALATTWPNGDYVGGGVFISLDSGATWRQTTAPGNSFGAVVCSQDGVTLAALGGSPVDLEPGAVIICSYCSYANPWYISTNAGITWAMSETPAVPAEMEWNALAVSGDGSQVVLVGSGQICVLQSPPPAALPLPPAPPLSIGLAGANPVLSWLVPSTDFVLQQNSDLGSTNWVDVTDQPTLNFTNLHNEVTLSPLSSKASSFFRLKQP
jgi:hypothetical protein